MQEKMIDVLSLHNEMQIIHKVAPAKLRQWHWSWDNGIARLLDYDSQHGW